MALTNLWGSYFSRIEQGGAMVRPLRRGLFKRMGLNMGPALPGQGLKPEVLRERVGTAGVELMPQDLIIWRVSSTYFSSWLEK